MTLRMPVAIMGSLALGLLLARAVLASIRALKWLSRQLLCDEPYCSRAHIDVGAAVTRLNEPRHLFERLPIVSKVAQFLEGRDAIIDESDWPLGRWYGLSRTHEFASFKQVKVGRLVASSLSDLRCLQWFS
jgi:hypothetical protein